MGTMPRITYGITLFLLMSIAVPSKAGDKAKLQWKNLGEGVNLAMKIEKKVLIDVYTDWCGWCKKMDADVYGDSTIIKYIHEMYVPIKLNAESSREHEVNGKIITEADLARSLGVRGYPSTVFVQPNGQVITRVSGYIKSGRFLKILEYIGGDHYLKMKFEEFVGKHGMGK